MINKLLLYGWLASLYLWAGPAHAQACAEIETPRAALARCTSPSDCRLARLTLLEAMYRWGGFCDTTGCKRLYWQTAAEIGAQSPLYEQAYIRMVAAQQEPMSGRRIAGLHHARQLLRQTGEGQLREQQLATSILILCAQYFQYSSKDSQYYYLQAANDLAMRVGLPLQRWDVTIGFHQFYATTKDYPAAIRMARRNCQIAKEISPSIEFISFANLSKLLYDGGYPDSALYYGNLALKMPRPYHRAALDCRIFIQKSKIYHDRNDVAALAQASDSAMHYARLSRQPDIVISAIRVRVMALSALRRYAEAIALAKKGMEMEQRRGHSIFHFELHRLTAQAYARMGDFAQAYRFDSLYHHRLDSAAAAEHQLQAREMDARYQSSQKDAAIKKLENEQLKVLATRRMWQIGLLALVFVVAGVATGIWYRQRRRIHQAALAEQQLLAERNQLNEMLALQEVKVIRAELSATEQERKRLAFLLHDSVAGTLAAAVHHTGYLRGIATEELHAPIDTLTQRLNTLYRQTRTLSHDLYPADEASSGEFAAELEAFVRFFFKSQPITPAILIENAEEINHLPVSKQVVVYHLVQEAIANILKHAQATAVSMELFVQDRTLHLILSDNGVGFDPGQSADGIGLRNLREQIAAHGGTFTVTSRPGEETILAATLPLGGLLAG